MATDPIIQLLKDMEVIIMTSIKPGSNELLVAIDLYRNLNEIHDKEPDPVE